MTEGVKRPPATNGMRHVALFVADLAAAEHFYVDLMGMAVEWRPDPENVYLSGGNDNLALHQAVPDFDPGVHQSLDHIGFMLDRIEDVDLWHDYLVAHNVEIRNPPRTHRDGARSFYCYDPAGTVVQIIYHPPLAGKA